MADEQQWYFNVSIIDERKKGRKIEYLIDWGTNDPPSWEPTRNLSTPLIDGWRERKAADESKKAAEESKKSAEEAKQAAQETKKVAEELKNATEQPKTPEAAPTSAQSSSSPTKRDPPPRASIETPPAKRVKTEGTRQAVINGSNDTVSEGPPDSARRSSRASRPSSKVIAATQVKDEQPSTQTPTKAETKSNSKQKEKSTKTVADDIIQLVEAGEMDKINGFLKGCKLVPL